MTNVTQGVEGSWLGRNGHRDVIVIGASAGGVEALKTLVGGLPGEFPAALGAAITFADITELARLADEQRDRKRELEHAYEELRSTVEELETTNEESAVDQRGARDDQRGAAVTNEELETMNEELQSTNDELETMNHDQHERSNELDRVNLFLEGILTSLGVGVVVLDRERRVQVWNADSTELWGVRSDEAEGQLLSDLDIGLQVAELDELVGAALGPDGAAATVTVDAVNRRGRHFTCVVRVLPLTSSTDQVSGVLLLMADRKALDTTLLPSKESGAAPGS